MNKYSLDERPSMQRHRRQRFWQIIFPVILIILLFLVAAVFTIRSGQNANRLWADISIIWLVAPWLMLSAVLVVILFALIYGLTRFTKVVPGFTRRIQNWFFRVEQETSKLADSVVKPILWTEQGYFSFKYLVKKIKNQK